MLENFAEPCPLLFDHTHFNHTLRDTEAVDLKKVVMEKML